MEDFHPIENNKLLNLGKLQINTNTISEIPNSIVKKKYHFDANGELLINNSKIHAIKPDFVVSNKEIISLKVVIQNMLVYNFPLDFCNDLCEFENNIPDRYIYKIPWNKLNFGYIYLACIEAKELRFLLDSSEPCIASLNTTIKVLNNNELVKLKNTCIFQQVVNIGTQQLEVSLGIVKQELQFVGMTKGFFIDGIDIKGINFLRLYFNDILRISYDKCMLSLFVKRISDKCIYVSLDNLPYNDTVWDTSVDLEKLNNVKIEMYGLDHNLDTINIRTLTYNKFVYENGNFIVKFKTNHHLVNYKIDKNSIPIYGQKFTKIIDTCPVCRCYESDVILSCNHQYCGDCLNILNKNDKQFKCPLCNSKIYQFYKLVKVK